MTKGALNSNGRIRVDPVYVSKAEVSSFIKFDEKMRKNTGSACNHSGQDGSGRDPETSAIKP